MDLLFTLIGRTQDLEQICQLVARAKSCSIVAVSNVGKSALLRRLCDPEQNSPCAGAFIYADCNRMPERTARAFFITAWQAISARLPSDELRVGAQHLYDAMVAAPSQITAALNFEAGLNFALDHLPHPLILCLDEFDEAYQHLEPQTFLNLRSLKDRYGDQLAYITATERELAHLTTTREQGEFLELISPRVHYVHWMTADETREFCRRFAAREGVTFSMADLDFICENAGGHPGLAQAICFALGGVTGAPKRDAQQDRVIHQIVRQNLATDANVQLELEKIFKDLQPDERAALSNWNLAISPNAAGMRGVYAKFVAQPGDDGIELFSPLFADYVRRQTLTQPPHARGVFLDVDAGEAFIDGKPTEPLTDLEFRLLTFLYGKLDRVCDKYSIVENVWGQQFIDEVDDARIEKLISRVRAKIEPDASKPRYLVSVRGRGYKLVR